MRVARHPAPGDGRIVAVRHRPGPVGCAAARLALGAAMAPAVVGCFSDSDVRGAVDAGATSTADAAEGTVVIARAPGSPVSPFAFGQNYWDWVDWADSGVTGLTGTAPLVAALGVNVIRAGGDNNDTNSPSLFDPNQIDAFVAYCRDAGAEPILQVPLVANAADGGPATAQSAADMVTYANVTRGYGIRYWEIGNEPDLYPTEFDGGFPIRSAGAYCAQYASYAAAMKAANGAAPDGGVPLTFLGPEIAQPNAAWLGTFLDGCKDDVDVVTLHRYPFGGRQTTPSGALGDVTGFRSALRSMAAVVAAHARPGTPLGVTESNISYDYAPSAYTPASLAAGPGSYYAAMWTADVMGAALESQLWTFALWNIGEADRTGSVLGFIVGGRPVPAYYAEQMIAHNFRGQELAPSGVPAGFSVYASYDAARRMTAVLVLNKTSAASRLTLAVDTLAPQAVDAPPLSITLAQISDSPDAAPSVLRYTADLADAGMPPQPVP